MTDDTLENLPTIPTSYQPSSMNKNLIDLFMRKGNMKELTDKLSKPQKAAYKRALKDGSFEDDLKVYSNVFRSFLVEHLLFLVQHSKSESIALASNVELDKRITRLEDKADKDSPASGTVINVLQVVSELKASPIGNRFLEQMTKGIVDV